MSLLEKHASLDHLNLTVANFRDSALWYEKIFGKKRLNRKILKSATGALFTTPIQILGM
jgi:4-hydroxyphenylpyruvate dioxygenase-like putative hemolysin